MKREIWIVAVSNSAGDGVDIYQKFCDEDTIKKFLIRLAKKDAGEDKEDFECGTESIDDINICGDRFDAYNSFSDYHIEYSAKRLDDVALYL